MRDVIILGSTGSIGTQALDVIARNAQHFRVTGLAAGGANLQLLAEQICAFRVPAVAIATDNEGELAQLVAAIDPHLQPEILCGENAVTELAGRGDTSTVVLNGITGSIGLRPTLAALASGASLALANKESLVVGGALVADAMVRPGQIIPVDSEHSAIAQALRSGRHNRGLTSEKVDGTSEVAKLILTASGGPFRGASRADLEHVTLEQALNHPTWDMGPVVTINSSTLMNKALELIEAAYLFDIPPADIIPVVHPQSIVHSMVLFRDGSTIAQASPPDMRLPIALGLSYPERLADISTPCVWDSPTSWHFEPLDEDVFPAIRLARQALDTSPLHPAVMNAANEEAVSAFIAGRLPYTGIIDTVSRVLDTYQPPVGTPDLKTVLGAETWARQCAHTIMERHSNL
ncbi:MAG: 1-deoxy-D-xylulose-5-phosphate reductoisomerase [Actinomycetaceae bacterium]|nr:1-deoxy-D-xylulose-5-phosphate reductoisomerase [Actinomycetaceae bacterium]